MYFSKNSILLFLFLLLPLVNTLSQELGSWNVLSSFSTVNTITASNVNDVYASTLGGIFVFTNDQLNTVYTTIDGMHRLDPSNSVYDEARNRLILTYPDGTIDLFNIDSELFQKNEDISRVNQFSSKSINEIILNGNELYVATDFGIVVFTLDGFFVNTSILKLGSFDRGIQVNDIDISGGIIYCATEQGVAIANLNTNLLEEASWTNYSEADGFQNEIINKVIEFNSDIYALVSDTLYSFNGISWDSNNDFGNTGIQDFYKKENELIVLLSDRVLFKNSEGIEQTIILDSNTRPLSAYISNNSLFIGTSDKGLLKYDINNISEQVSFLPDGPYLNFFSKLDVVDKTLVSTSTSVFPQADPFNPVRGYYLFQDGEWLNYNIRTSHEMAINRFGSVFSQTSTSTDYYFGSWGRGVLRHNIATNDISIFNANNTELTGIADSRSFIVITGMDNDNNDNVWVTSFDSENPLNMLQSGSDDWSHFRKVSIPTDNLYFNLFVDSNNQKWISLVDFGNNGKGLLILDTGDPLDEADDKFRKLTADRNNGNLPDELITSIIEDKNGEIWIGSSRGIARFIFPDFIIDSNNSNDYEAQWLINEDTSAISRFLLRDVNVSSIAINEANQKWIGSVNQGVWLLNEEGSRIEKRFTNENSPLISNNILSITIKDDTGEVFIATDLGLVSYKDLAITPVNKMGELKVFPNPFSYSRNSQIIIEGLSEETEIKIIGVDGTVVQELETRGGRVSWDGLDFLGNRLGTGVYFVVSLEKNGSEKGVGKVVIIK